MKSWELVIFDWDGTLADSVSSIVLAMQQAAAAIQVPVPAAVEVREIIGLGLPEAINQLFPGLPEARYPDLRAAYAESYIAQHARIPLFPGVVEMLEALRQQGVRMAVATGKSRLGLDRALNASGMAEFFHATRCADEGPGKPEPDMTHYLLSQLDVAAGSAVLVGDTAHDLEMARRAGLAAVGVGWGAHDVPRLQAYNPLLVASTVAELHECLVGNPGSRLP